MKQDVGIYTRRYKLSEGRACRALGGCTSCQSPQTWQRQRISKQPMPACSQCLRPHETLKLPTSHILPHTPRPRTPACRRGCRAAAAPTARPGEPRRGSKGPCAAVPCAHVVHPSAHWPSCWLGTRSQPPWCGLRNLLAVRVPAAACRVECHEACPWPGRVGQLPASPLPRMHAPPVPTRCLVLHRPAPQHTSSCRAGARPSILPRTCIRCIRELPLGPKPSPAWRRLARHRDHNRGR